jgi:hypothetical protein
VTTCLRCAEVVHNPLGWTVVDNSELSLVVELQGDKMVATVFDGERVGPKRRLDLYVPPRSSSRRRIHVLAFSSKEVDGEDFGGDEFPDVTYQAAVEGETPWRAVGPPRGLEVGLIGPAQLVPTGK